MKNLAAKGRLHQALNDKKVSLAELEQFSNLKIESSKLGISLEDVQQFVTTIQGVRQLGYSVDSNARVVSDLEGSSRIQAKLDKHQGARHGLWSWGIEIVIFYNKVNLFFGDIEKNYDTKLG